MDTPRKIGKYEIQERIGQGGFGLVYKARDPFIKRLVAIKVCTSSDETLKKRFIREAEIAGNLHHRSIVTVFEFGYDAAGPFLVQEYLPGEDLDTKIRRRDELTLAVKVRYLLQIGRALEYAHKKGILHRDIKPSNIRVLEDDRVKILDFGIAKLAGAETQLTRTGKVLGTAGYLSPEQLKGEPVDARSDVFSFGVLAYELMSYEHPFPGTTISELLHQVVEVEPDPLPTLAPECPPEVAAMIARCLEKDPARRYPGFPEVCELLAGTLAELEPSVLRRPLESLTEETMLPGERAKRLRPGSATVRRLTPAPNPAATSDASGPESVAEHDLEATQLVDQLSPPKDAPPPLPPLPPSPTPGTSGPPPVHEEPPTERTAPAIEADAPPGLASRLILAAGVTLLICLAAAVLWWIAQTPQSSPAAVDRPAVAAETGSEASVVVDAVPWGRLIQVTDAAGESIPLPPETTTPLTLHLPPGEYTLELLHPQAEAPATCTVTVRRGSVGHCRVELVRIDPSEYFEESGWWR